MTDGHHREMDRGSSSLDRTFASLLVRREAQGRLRRLTVPKPGTVDFSSNGYLSLSSNERIRQAYLDLLRQSTQIDDDKGDCASHDHEAFEAFSLGSGGSRLLDGNSSGTEALERRIAAFHGAQSGLLFNSGFEANTGLLACVPQVGDVVVYDELIHASVHDGMKLSRAGHLLPFAHNRVRVRRVEDPASGDDGGQTRSLEAVLQGLPDDCRSGGKNVFIVVEGVYSMDGDVAPLRDIVECVQEKLPSGNGYIVVDEAHSTGLFGDHGRGLVCELGLEERIWARVHTFGKAMGCSGAVVLCSPTTREYLINYARSFIYTTAMGFPARASIQVAYDFLSDGHARPLVTHLRRLTRDTHELLMEMVARLRVPADVFWIRAGLPESPILPIFSSRARSLALACQSKGFMLRPVVAPTVPKGTDRVRLCLHAGNTMAEVNGLCEVLEAWAAAQMMDARSRL